MALLFDKGLWIILNNQDRILERCCSDVSLTSSCSTMEWRQTSEQLIAPELAPQQSINSTTEEKVVLCIWLADCPFNFIITLCCCTLTFQPHDFLSVGVTNLKRLCVNATAGRRLSAVVGCLRWSAALEFWFSRFSSLWTFDFMFQLCHAILSKTYMPWRAEFSKAFSSENSRCYETMKLWNYETSVLWLWFNPILTLLLLYRAPVSCLQSPALSAVGLQTVNTAWRTETLVVLNNVQTFR